MKRTLTKALSLLLAALTVGMTAACSNASPEPEETPDSAPADASESVSAETVEEEPEEEYVRANLPERDFDGETFTFYARIYNGVWSSSDILVTETTGEQINDALFQRTVNMEETYDLKLAAIEAGETMLSGAKTLITAGDTSFQSIVSDVYDAGGLATSSMLRDLNHVDNLDLSQRWWAQQANESMSLVRKQFYATGDIFIIDNKATRIFFFNKDLVTDLSLANPYGLVLEGTWDYDKFFDMCEATTADLNGDGAMNRKDDRYGLMGQTTLGEVLLIAAGESMTKKDADDIPYISCNSERAITVMTAIMEKVSAATSISQDGSNSITGVHPDNLEYFQEGRVLFAPEVLVHIETMRDCDVDIGIIPPPKYEEAQDGYYCYADGWCVNVVSLPITNTDTEKIGFVLEAMAADSLNNLTPAYYDVCLTKKYVRDQESVAMLDLILSSAVMDNANIFSWGGLESTINSALANGSPVASAIEKVMKPTNKMIEKAVAVLQECEG